MADIPPSLRAQIRAALRTGEHRRAARNLLVGLVLVASVLVWLAAAWPHLLPPALRRLGLGAWALGFAGAGLAAVSELRWRRRRCKLVAALVHTEVAVAPTPKLPKAVATRGG